MNEQRLKGFVFGTDEKNYSLHDDKLRFRYMGGAGNFYCRECGHEEYIVSFLHGFEEGLFCPKCRSFRVEYKMKLIT